MTVLQASAKSQESLHAKEARKISPFGRNDKTIPSTTNTCSRYVVGEGSVVTTLKSPIQASVLNRLGDVGGLDFIGAGEVGDGAADFEDPTVGAGAQA